MREGQVSRSQAGSKRARYMVIATFGNVVEWFDFTVYGFLAVIISQNFFPSGNSALSLLASFATFGVGFGARPIGALVLGRLGDRRGRKFVMLLSIVIMAGASLLIGIAPTHSTAGMWGAVIIVVARLMQGFSAGGEYGSAIAYLIEWAPPRRTGLFGSFHQIGSAGGLLLGSLMVAILNTLLTPAEMLDWGWRVPFLVGGVLAVLAYVMRRTLGESPIFEKLDQSTPAAPVSVGRPMFQTIGITALWTVSVFASIVYMPTFTVQHAGLEPKQALWATSMALLALLACIPVAGHLSDRFGRKALILTSAIGYMLLTWPGFLLITSSGSFAVVVAVQIVFAVLSAMISGPAPATVGELFPPSKRSTWTSIGIAIAVTIFGGFAPFIATLLIARTGSPLSPAIYIVGVAVLTALTALTLAARPRRTSIAHDALAGAL